MRPRTPRLVAATFISAVLTLNAGAQTGSQGGHWVSAWSTAVHTPLPFPGLPPNPVFENQTIRMVVRPAIDGQRLRILLSNEFGSSALEIGSAHVALEGKGPPSLRILTVL